MGKKYRASMHNGKRSQKTGRIIKPKHNDEERGKGKNMAKERINYNVYYNFFDGEYTEENKIGKLTFEQTEIRCYNNWYSAALEAQNERHIKSRHKDRVKKMEDWLESPTYAPTETILRFGNVDDGYPDLADLLDMGKEYIGYLEKWSSEHNNCLHILDWALHGDEVYVDDDTGEVKPSTPHIHIRWVMDYEDENGIRTIGKDKALENAGYSLPNPQKEKDRFNNRNMVFTAECRKAFQEIGMKHGYDIETEPLPQKRKSTDKESFVARKRAEKSEKKALDTQKQYQMLIEQEQIIMQQMKNAIASANAREQAADKAKAQYLEKQKLADEERANFIEKQEALENERNQVQALKVQEENIIRRYTNKVSEINPIIDEIHNILHDSEIHNAKVKDAVAKEKLESQRKSIFTRFNYAANYFGVNISPSDETDLSFK